MLNTAKLGKMTVFGTFASIFRSSRMVMLMIYLKDQIAFCVDNSFYQHYQELRFIVIRHVHRNISTIFGMSIIFLKVMHQLLLNC